VPLNWATPQRKYHYALFKHYNLVYAVVTLSQQPWLPCLELSVKENQLLSIEILKSPVCEKISCTEWLRCASCRSLWLRWNLDTLL